MVANNPAVSSARKWSAVAAALAGCTNPAPFVPPAEPLETRCSTRDVPGAASAGLPADMACQPGQRQVEGECQPAGVPPAACALGFMPDGYGGCEALLAGKCKAGHMAIPGDVECREVAPCADGDYGNIPVEPTTQFVNVAYGGGGSDGTEAHPWMTINDAVAAANDGAIVAIAAGSYPAVKIYGKRVRLWGRCPALVTINGAAQLAKIVVGGDADGTEIHDLSVTGATLGAFVSQAKGVVFDRVWMHDLASAGIAVTNGSGAASAQITRSLIDHAKGAGVVAIGAEVDVEDSMIRGTRRDSQGVGGAGIDAEGAKQDTGPQIIRVRGSVIENNQRAGALAVSAELIVEASVVRDTVDAPPDADSGIGVGASYAPNIGRRPSATIRGSIIERNISSGFLLVGGDAIIEASVIRNTEPRASGGFGRGVDANGSADGGPAALTIRDSLVDGNQEIGIFLASAEGTIEGTLVRETLPNGNGAGHGIELLDRDETFRRHNIVRFSIIEGSVGAGVAVIGSDLAMESSIVRATSTDATGAAGTGVAIQASDAKGPAGKALVRASIIEDNRSAGLIALGATLTLESSIVRGTLPDGAGLFGRGVSVEADVDTGLVSTLTVTASLIQDNADVGIYVSGGTAHIESTAVCDTRADAANQFGRGISIQHDPDLGPADAVIVSTVIDGSADLGIFVSGSKADIEDVLVRDSLAEGVVIQRHLGSGARSFGMVCNAQVLRSTIAGIAVLGSSASIEDTLVMDTRDEDGFFGDGIAVISEGDLATVGIARCSIDRSARAGISNFGANVTLDHVTVGCSAFALEGELFNGVSFQYFSEGGNVCECMGAEEDCHTATTNIEPPPPVD